MKFLCEFDVIASEGSALGRGCSHTKLLGSRHAENDFHDVCMFCRHLVTESRKASYNFDKIRAKKSPRGRSFNGSSTSRRGMFKSGYVCPCRDHQDHR